jgi:hypothetical protein
MTAKQFSEVPEIDFVRLPSKNPSQKNLKKTFERIPAEQNGLFIFLFSLPIPKFFFFSHRNKGFSKACTCIKLYDFLFLGRLIDV